MQRRVRFARKNDTHWIERRGEERLSKDHIDDEVKDHPAFAAVLSSPDPNPSIPYPVLSNVNAEYAQTITTQINSDPQCKTVLNPITKRNITRFGHSYWKLITTLFGAHSPMMNSEKEIYRQIYNKK